MKAHRHAPPQDGLTDIMGRRVLAWPPASDESLRRRRPCPPFRLPPRPAGAAPLACRLDMSVRLSSLLAPRQASLVARQLPPRSRSFVASPAFRSPPPPPPAPSSRFQNAFLFLSSPTSSSTAQSQCLSTSAAQSINGVHPPRPDKPDYREMSPQERKKAGEQEAEQSLSTSWNSESPPAYQKKLANGMTEGMSSIPATCI